MKNVHILTVKYAKSVKCKYNLLEREKVEVKDGLLSFTHLKQLDNRTVPVRMNININCVEWFEDYEEDFDDEGNVI